MERQVLQKLWLVMMIELMKLDPLIIIYEHIFLLRSRKHCQIMQELHISRPLSEIGLKNQILLLPVKHAGVALLPCQKQLDPISRVVQSVRSMG